MGRDRDCRRTAVAGCAGRRCPGNQCPPAGRGRPRGGRCAYRRRAAAAGIPGIRTGGHPRAQRHRSRMGAVRGEGAHRPALHPDRRPAERRDRQLQPGPRCRCAGDRRAADPRPGHRARQRPGVERAGDRADAGAEHRGRRSPPGAQPVPVRPVDGGGSASGRAACPARRASPRAGPDPAQRILAPPAAGLHRSLLRGRWRHRRPARGRHRSGRDEPDARDRRQPGRGHGVRYRW